MEENQETQPIQDNEQSLFASCPDNNLVWAILCTTLCCLPLGIVAIVKACSVDRLWLQGRYDEANAAAKSARNFSIWGVVIAVLGFFFYIMLLLVAMTFGGSAALMNL